MLQLQYIIYIFKFTKTFKLNELMCSTAQHRHEYRIYVNKSIFLYAPDIVSPNNMYGRRPSSDSQRQHVKGNMIIRFNAHSIQISFLSNGAEARPATAYGFRPDEPFFHGYGSSRQSHCITVCYKTILISLKTQTL